MSDNIIGSIFDALNAANSGNMYEHLTWYTCPRGHPYTVGNGGKPMQETSCTAPGCTDRGGRDSPRGAARGFGLVLDFIEKPTIVF